MADVDAFLSYSRSDLKWADRLSSALANGGLAIWMDRERLTPGSSWASELKDVVSRTKNIIVLVGRRGEPDVFQSREARVLLEAVWGDPGKRVIPVLMGHVNPPGFVRSATRGEVAAIRVQDPQRDWDRAMQDLVKVLKNEATLEKVGETIDTTSEDRARQEEGLSYIRDVAESFDKESSGD